MKINEKLSGLINLLKSRTDVDIVSDEINFSSLPFIESNLTLGDSIVEFYKKIYSINLEWDIIPENSEIKWLDYGRDIIGGSIRLSSPEILLNGPEGKGWLDKLSTLNQNSSIIKNLLVIDPEFPNAAAGLLVIDNKIDDNVFYVHERFPDQIFDLKMTVTEYYSKAVENAGLYDWPLSLTGKHQRSELIIKHYIPQLLQR